MDTSDSEIKFDDQGICNHCYEFDTVTSKSWFPNAEGEKKLSDLLKRVREEGKNKKYDCIIGLSGGIDSSYLALKLKKFDLKPLVVHVDGGWNTELASNNISRIVEHCSFDLFTHVVNWKEMRDLQVAYLKSGISNQDVPQDHIFFSILYHYATKNKIKYVISGGNTATEGVFPNSWHGSAMDSINLHAIHKRYGKIKLKHYKTINFFKYYVYFPIILGMRTIRPLNYMVYNKEMAVEELKKIGYVPYKYKHGESVWTRFFQNYYLPKKFGYDKRLPHLSSMILSGQLKRHEALKQLEDELYSEDQLRIDIGFISKKLKLSEAELMNLIDNKNQDFKDYPNWLWILNIVRKAQKIYSFIFKKDIKIYS